MDFENRASRLGVDKEDFIELVELFITTSQSDLDKIRRGLADAAPEKVAAAAHSIKGAAGNLGFEEMAALAKKMEFQGKEGRLDDFDAWIHELAGFLNQLRDKLTDE